LKIPRLTYTLILPALIIISCNSVPETSPESGSVPASEPVVDTRQITGGLVDEIRGLVETGRLVSINQALDIIQNRNLNGIEFGRLMNGIITIIVRNVYPDSMLRLPSLDLPPTHNYSRIIREAERGNYTSPGEQSSDFFEYMLPFMVINDYSRPEILAKAIDDLIKARELRPASVLPSYYLGLIYEHIKQYDNALITYKNTLDLYDDFYPASIGTARVLMQSGEKEEAAAIYSDLIIRYPDNLGVKRQLAIIYYEEQNWSRAGPAVDEILQHEPRNGDFLLMRAHILIEQGNFLQANTPLDTFASINSNDRFYLFLRARVQAEGSRNRDSALNYLRSIIRTNHDDEEALIFAVTLLMESQRPADQNEGRELLKHLQQIAGSSIVVLSLSLHDAVYNENWREAQGFLNRILAVRRTTQDLIDAYHVEHGLGNNARALSYARELYERDTSNSDYIIIYISALIDNNRTEEASTMLAGRLASSGSGAVISRYYYLRSRIQSNEESALNDLRSSLFEDPRNLDAIIAMFEIYHRRREERRAVYYLRQAMAIAPDNPVVRRYEREYAALLGRN